jgi:hypothetical protein
MADVHRFGDVGRTEINNYRSGLAGFLEEQMVAARRGPQRFRKSIRLKSEVQETRAGDFHLLAPLTDIEFRDDVRSKLAGIELARLGQSHHRIALVITKLGVGTRLNENVGDICAGQHRPDSFLKSQFNLIVWQHEFDLTTDGHGWTRIKFTLG